MTATENAKQTELLKRLKELLPGHYYEKIIHAKSEKEAFDSLPTRYHRLVQQAVAELDRAGEEDGAAQHDDGMPDPIPPVPPKTEEVSPTPPATEAAALTASAPKVTEAAKAVPAKPLKGK